MAAARRQQQRRRVVTIVVVVAAVLGAALLISALGGDDVTDVATESPETSETTETTAVTPVEPMACETAAPAEADMSAKPEVVVPEGEPPAELQCTDVVVGDGEEAAVGDRIEVHYVGVSYSDGEQFDASWDGGEPITFPLLQDQLIDGWVQGIPGMKVGGRRQLVIPPALAYGDTGQGSIAPGETLVFVIDLISVEKA
jgi:peptidylprolyl isomerase